MRVMFVKRHIGAFLLGLFFAGQAHLWADELWVGTAIVDITPSRPVALDGQRHVRIARQAATPITATALALEGQRQGKPTEQAVIVSCDIVTIRDGILEAVRKKVQTLTPDLDVNKIILCATHTHTAPVTQEGRYTIPGDDVMQPQEYAEWLTGRMAEAVAQAWKARRPTRVGWGQGQAVIARNRRAVYADGSAQMYGRTDVPEFRGLESMEDHDVDVLFFWDNEDRLKAVAINIACPAQEVEGLSVIHADFWHPVRERLREKYGAELAVVALTGAGGDVTPHLMYGHAADERARKLRGLDRLGEIARRLVRAVEEALEVAEKDKRNDVVFRHLVQEVGLPYRRITKEEAAQAAAEAAKFANNPAERWNYLWHQRVVERFERQQAGANEMFVFELHAIRLEDVGLVTNPFELYTDYGIQIKARSPAVQTLVVTLTGSGGYLPTERAVRGGGYGAVPQSTPVGPEGGQILVDRSVAALKSLWQ
ncbi:MAG: hypothetical protein NZ899_07450 [Thermoguttaceae bacterium]|nr:hypothetical protein [Thermoguttaceae bacterium]MDW8078978.1 hypothetical protein [Thermoguttaceae bacterium]